MPKPGTPTGSNRGFDAVDPQKRLAPRTSESSGGNFADDPERTSVNLDQLRDEIDREKIGDTANTLDPAATSRGTDTEAKGTMRLDDPEDPPVADRGKADQLQRRPKLPT